MQKVKVITDEKAKELETMLFNFDAEIICTAHVVNDAAKLTATYEAHKQLIDTLRELSETCRAFANILDEEVAAIQDMQRIASKTKKRVRRVPVFVPTTDEHGDEAFKKNPILDELAE